MEELKFLEEQQVSSELIKRIEEFRSQYEVASEAAGRIVKPSIPFYGKDILEMAIAVSPEAYVKENGRFPILESTCSESGDVVIVTGDNQGSFVRYTFTE